MGEIDLKIMSTNRVKVLDLINRFGVIANKQMFKYFEGEITYHSIYKILDYLEKENFIVKSNIGRVFYVYIRPNAAAVVSEPMYKFNRLNQTELLHDLRVNDYLINRYVEAKNDDRFKRVSFTTERELIDEYLIENENKITDTNYTRQIDKLKRHMADGILEVEYHDNRIVRTAIEYELTQKGKMMYEKIMNRYNNMIKSGQIDLVIYIVKGRRIQRKIEQVMSEQEYNFRIVFKDADEVFE